MGTARKLWLPPRPRSWLRLPASRAGRRRALWAAMAVCSLALTPATWVYVSATPRVRDAGHVPSAPVAMVFGAGLWEGRPSPYLAHRLDTAAGLYRAGKVRVVLVTGDNSRDDYDEPDAMRAYLRDRGVPDARIVSDFAGFDTWDSCARARRVFGVKQAVLISQGFHIRRALALCGAAGIDAYGVGASSDPHDITWYAGGAREVLASGKAALDALVRPSPAFLGPHEPGVERALADEGP
ncbi:hypothetical protein BLA24_21470 [Streptomyces cinnamoneus]|uniref:DUF218 domain-containing protein n=1 Tax=Streptomyces cinnamoneus TaxID=53446 RepID=A0A2G1XFZ0_STRCJ|nr:ElyC/SanA/YdcF family protein [Streptomyces cinnamoneus]PHQ50152.1 hypothetical protein BLA24_21470 [Streptomyces cinnamoneus]PPT13065.1 hypothetical protein CYQ11_09315 [Streptomyces cinnamoneus]